MAQSERTFKRSLVVERLFTTARGTHKENIDKKNCQQTVNTARNAITARMICNACSKKFNRWRKEKDTSGFWWNGLAAIPALVAIYLPTKSSYCFCLFRYLHYYYYDSYVCQLELGKQVILLAVSGLLMGYGCNITYTKTNVDSLDYPQSEQLD